MRRTSETAHYAIGDVHGCWRTLRTLLGRIDYRPKHDRLWFVGDVINRGPGSLEVLEFIREHESQVDVVLGNHELHLLAIADGVREPRRRDTLDPILNAPDADDWIEWIRSWPFMVKAEIPIAGKKSKTATWQMVHAGFSPRWDPETLRSLAKRARKVLPRSEGHRLVRDLYDDTNLRWDPDGPLEEQVQAFVRFAVSARTCKKSGRLDPEMKGPPEEATPGRKAWFEWLPEADGSAEAPYTVFGHWAALGYREDRGRFGLDSGCAWGGELTALRLEDRQPFHVGVDARDR